METAIAKTGALYQIKPIKFPFDSESEFIAADYMKGCYFLYHPEYGSKPYMFKCARVCVTHYPLYRTEQGLKLNVIKVRVVRDNGIEYDWERCELVEPETSASEAEIAEIDLF